MQLPGTPSLVFLIYLLLFLSWAALRSAHKLREVREASAGELSRILSREWALWTVTVVVASVSEEIAYRGVAMWILRFSLGNAWVAALVCSAAFALGHSIQGWKSGVVIFVLALAMHGLVAFTGTLVLAMLVHAAYDFVAGYLIAKEAGRYGQAAAQA